MSKIRKKLGQIFLSYLLNFISIFLAVWIWKGLNWKLIIGFFLLFRALDIVFYIMKNIYALIQKRIEMIIEKIFFFSEFVFVAVLISMLILFRIVFYFFNKFIKFDFLTFIIVVLLTFIISKIFQLFIENFREFFKISTNN